MAILLQEGAEESRYTAVEDEEWVTWILSKLPPVQREVMELHAEGLTAAGTTWVYTLLAEKVADTEIRATGCKRQMRRR